MLKSTWFLFVFCKFGYLLLIKMDKTIFWTYKCFNITLNLVCRY